MYISIKVFFLYFVIILSVLSFQTSYADRIVSSQQLVEDLYSDLVVTSMKELSTDEQETKLKNLFEKYVDIPIIARAVLGKSWRDANSDQETIY